MSCGRGAIAVLNIHGLQLRHEVVCWRYNWKHNVLHNVHTIYSELYTYIQYLFKYLDIQYDIESQEIFEILTFTISPSLYSIQRKT